MTLLLESGDARLDIPDCAYTSESAQHASCTLDVIEGSNDCWERRGLPADS